MRDSHWTSDELHCSEQCYVVTDTVKPSVRITDRNIDVNTIPAMVDYPQRHLAIPG
jgi:hypothetical protein